MLVGWRWGYTRLSSKTNWGVKYGYCTLTVTLNVLNFWKLTSYCSLKPLWSGMGEVVPSRTSPTLHPPSPPTVHPIVATSTLRVKLKQCIHSWLLHKSILLQWLRVLVICLADQHIFPIHDSYIYISSRSAMLISLFLLSYTYVWFVASTCHG